MLRTDQPSLPSRPSPYSSIRAAPWPSCPQVFRVPSTRNPGHGLAHGQKRERNTGEQQRRGTCGVGRVKIVVSSRGREAFWRVSAITTTNTNTRKRGRGSGGQHFDEHFQFSLIRIQENVYPHECRSRSRAASPDLPPHNPDSQLPVFSFKPSLEALEWTQPRNSLCRSVASPHKKNRKKKSLVQDIHRILCVILLRYGGVLQTLLPPRRLTSSAHQTPRLRSLPPPPPSPPLLYPCPCLLLPASNPFSLPPHPFPRFHLPTLLTLPLSPSFTIPLPRSHRPQAGKCKPEYQHEILNKTEFSLDGCGPRAGEVSHPDRGSGGQDKLAARHNKTEHLITSSLHTEPL